MERTRSRIAKSSTRARRTARRLGTGLLVMSGVVALGGCYVVPAPVPVVAPAPVIVAPAPVYVTPGPVYGWGGYGWRRHRHW
jgi:hypothetical protein